MKKQKGFSFLELVISVLILIVLILIIFGVFGHASLMLRRNIQLSTANLLAQKVMERTLYQTAEEIQANSVTPGWVNFTENTYNKYQYKVTLENASGPLTGFVKVKVAIKTPQGQEIDLTGLKKGTGGGSSWKKCYGGTNCDYAYGIQQTADGYVFVGRTGSNNGDVSGNHGYTDGWIVKIDSNGNIQWQKCIGGSNWDDLFSVKQTPDGGYIVVGDTSSNDGTIQGLNHLDASGNPTCDGMIIKLNSNGEIQWKKVIGGSALDSAFEVELTPDGGYVVGGRTQSNDGDVSGFHGGTWDYWVVKLDSSGNIQWQKCLGSSSTEDGYSIDTTSDDGYVMAGYKNPGPKGGPDYYIVKLDSSGNTQWEKNLGGTGWDYAFSVKQTSDGGYITGGRTGSNNGDVSGNHGNYDMWIVKLNSTGNIQWQKCLGGSDLDQIESINQTLDGGYIVAGATRYTPGNPNPNGDVEEIHASTGSAAPYWTDDQWIVKLDSNGNIQWKKCFGGGINDYSGEIIQTYEGGYILAGYSASIDGDVTGQHGLGDCWIIKMDQDGR